MESVYKGDTIKLGSRRATNRQREFSFLVDNLFLANITCEHPGNSAASLSAESKSRTFPPCLSLILSDEITFLRLMALFDDDRIY